MAQEERIAELRVRRSEIRQEMKPLQDELDAINAELSNLVNDTAADEALAKMSPALVESIRRRASSATA